MSASPSAADFGIRFNEVLRARLGNFVPSERRYLMGRDWKKSSENGFEVRHPFSKA